MWNASQCLSMFITRNCHSRNALGIYSQFSEILGNLPKLTEFFLRLAGGRELRFRVLLIERRWLMYFTLLYVTLCVFLIFTKVRYSSHPLCKFSLKPCHCCWGDPACRSGEPGWAASRRLEVPIVSELNFCYYQAPFFSPRWEHDRTGLTARSLLVRISQKNLSQ